MLFHKYVKSTTTYYFENYCSCMCVCVRASECVSCYMALFSFRLFFFYIRSISRNDLIHSSNTRHSKWIQLFSLSNFLLLPFALPHSSFALNSFIWITTMVDRRNQISVADKGILTSSLFCFVSVFFIHCRLVHCLPQQQTTASMKRIRIQWANDHHNVYTEKVNNNKSNRTIRCFYI